jgi:hypothetical protein
MDTVKSFCTEYSGNTVLILAKAFALGVLALFGDIA